MMHSVCEAIAEHQINTENRISVLRSLNIELTIKHKNALGSFRNNDKVFANLKRPVKFDIIIIVVVLPLFYFVIYLKIQY